MELEPEVVIVLGAELSVSVLVGYELMMGATVGGARVIASDVTIVICDDRVSSAVLDSKIE